MKTNDRFKQELRRFPVKSLQDALGVTGPFQIEQLAAGPENPKRYDHQVQHQASGGGFSRRTATKWCAKFGLDPVDVFGESWLEPDPVTTVDVRRRIQNRCIPNPETGCWEWHTGRDTNGYGIYILRGKQSRAHRVSYEEYIGPIPEGLVLDHLCRNRSCVNPQHLEPVTVLENARRGSIPNSKYCRNDLHEMTAENVIRRGGFRHCRACEKARLQRYAKKTQRSGK